MSPMRQLALLALITDAVRDRAAQFIVATHSPILMAAPGATIYSFDGGAVRTVPYADLEHVRFTREFLNAPEAFLRHL
jgi:predicted ATPase